MVIPKSGIIEKNILNLSHKNIEKFEDDLLIPNEIKYLDISYNSLVNFPNNLNISNLIELNLAYNNISIFSRLNYTFDYLSYLNLSHNNLNSIPEELLTNFPMLQILDLSYNHILECNKPFKCYKYLRKLFLNHNNLSTFPIWVFNVMCKNLQEINLESNLSLIGFSDILPPLLLNKSLKSLNLNDCSLNMNSVQFLESFTNIESLSINNINHCYTSLWEFQPFNIQWKKYIKILKLSNIFLTNVPICFKYLENLEYLDLSNNNLNWLNSHLTCLKLKYCNLSNNSILYLPENIGELHSLKHLDLSSNKITELPNSFVNLKNLTYLDLYNNELENAWLSLDSFPHLESLDLCYNYINIPFEDLNYKTLLNKIRELKEGRTNNNKTKQEVILFEDDKISIVTSNDSGTYESISQENDFWDDDDDIDNDFDPTRIESKISNPSSINEYNLIYRNNFCPSFYHPKTILSKKVKLEIVEGQFDDA